MPTHLPVAVELNGYRYEATHQPATDTWQFARTQVAGRCPAHNFPGYDAFQREPRLLPEDVLKTMMGWALTECTLY